MKCVMADLIAVRAFTPLGQMAVHCLTVCARSLLRLRLVQNSEELALQLWENPLLIV